MTTLTQQIEKETEFYLKQLSPLVGGKITGLSRTGVEYGDEFFGIVITLPNGEKKALILLADDEGNGHGSFEIVPAE